MSDDPLAWVDRLTFNQSLKALRSILMRHDLDFHTKPWVDSATLRKVVRCLLKLETELALERGADIVGLLD